jgi:hypothetical protein
MKAVHPLGGLPVARGEPERIADPDSPYHEDLSVGLYVALGFRNEPAVAGWYLARLQRAPEGAGESARRGCHQVVEGGCVGLVHCGADAVVGRNL